MIKQLLTAPGKTTDGAAIGTQNLASEQNCQEEKSGSLFKAILRSLEQANDQFKDDAGAKKANEEIAGIVPQPVKSRNINAKSVKVNVETKEEEARVDITTGPESEIIESEAAIEKKPIIQNNEDIIPENPEAESAESMQAADGVELTHTKVSGSGITKADTLTNADNKGSYSNIVNEQTPGKNEPAAITQKTNFDMQSTNYDSLDNQSIGQQNEISGSGSGSEGQNDHSNVFAAQGSGLLQDSRTNDNNITVKQTDNGSQIKSDPETVRPVADSSIRSDSRNLKITNQLQAQAPASAIKQNVKAEPSEAPDKTINPVQAVSEKVKAAEVEDVPQLNQEIQSQKAEEIRTKKYREHYSPAGRTDRISLQPGPSESGQAVSGEPQNEIPVNYLKMQPEVSSELKMSYEQELILKEQLKETVESTEKKETASNLFSKLGEIPLANISIRRTVMPSLTQAVQKSISAGKMNPETWQKHSFELDDGNNIQLSTRQVDGVLQVKLLSSNMELTRLIQQYEQEIKQHLEQECDVEVNLQFTADEGDDETSNFFTSSDSSNTVMEQGTHSFGTEHTGPNNRDQHIQNTVRRFGYNQMEWTA